MPLSFNQVRDMYPKGTRMSIPRDSIAIVEKVVRGHDDEPLLQLHWETDPNLQFIAGPPAINFFQGGKRRNTRRKQRRQRRRTLRLNKRTIH